MKSLSLPYSSFDWEQSEDLSRVPSAIEAIRSATDSSAASAAYWRVDNVVVVQGDLRVGAIEVASCAVVVLADCSTSGVPYLLDLLLQLASGELGPGQAERAEACRRAVAAGLPLFLGLSIRGSEEVRALAVDLVGQSLPYYPPLRGLSEAYLRYSASDSTLSPAVRDLANQWLSDLEEWDPLVPDP